MYFLCDIGKGRVLSRLEWGRDEFFLDLSQRGKSYFLVSKGGKSSFSVRMGDGRVLSRLESGREEPFLG